jgi:hypothetical protein
MSAAANLGGRQGAAARNVGGHGDMPVIETAVIVKIAGTVKGATVIAAQKGITVQVIQNFGSVAHSHGLVAGLKWLAEYLSLAAEAAGVVAALRKLIASIESGDTRKAITSGADVVAAMISKQD